MFAILSAMEDYSRLELFMAPTEKLQHWLQPKPVSVPPMKVSDPNEASSSSKPDLLEVVNYHALLGAPSDTPIFSVVNGREEFQLFQF